MHHPLNSQPSPRMIWISLSRIKATRVEDPDETPAAIIALLLQVLPEVASKAKAVLVAMALLTVDTMAARSLLPLLPLQQQAALVAVVTMAANLLLVTVYTMAAKALLLPPHHQQAVFLAVVTMAVKANPLLLLGTVDSLLAEYIRINLTIPILIPVAKVGKCTAHFPIDICLILACFLTINSFHLINFFPFI